MKITLYNNNSLPNVLNKTIQEIETLDIVVKGDNLDVSTPILYIAGVDMSTINYVYIQELERYYFITGFEHVKNNLIKISLEIDVLMTFKDSILSSSGIVTETETLENNYASDFEVLDTTQEKIFSFPSQQFTNEYYLYLTGAN